MRRKKRWRWLRALPRTRTRSRPSTPMPNFYAKLTKSLRIWRSRSLIGAKTNWFSLIRRAPFLPPLVSCPKMWPLKTQTMPSSKSSGVFWAVSKMRVSKLIISRSPCRSLKEFRLRNEKLNLKLKGRLKVSKSGWLSVKKESCFSAREVRPNSRTNSASSTSTNYSKRVIQIIKERQIRTRNSPLLP